MIFHVVHAREHAGTFLAVGSAPFAFDSRIVFGLVPSPILLGAEAARQGLVVGLCTRHCCGLALRTPFYSAEEMLAMPVVMLP